MIKKNTPTGLILSRQNIKDIPAMGASRYKEALAAEKGGYLVKKVDNPDVVLIANGSEVSTLIAAAEILESENGLKVNIASVISEGVFRLQSKEYQNSIIPKNKPLFGLTAGLPVNLEGLVGDKGKVFGLDHFGYSAPANVLDEKFGFTGEKVSKQVLEYLKTV
ncbi:transketolase-like TK C-terminal-containing protein [Mariniflexile sp.]|uniref:transketolase-like TK C-terminal-containing protein n=1 Tax=Mariniflexile sp. TaxID=1979402 RepID=UPI0040470BCB